MGLTLARMCRHHLIIATKRRDPLLDSLRRSYLVTQDLKRDVLWAGDEPIHKNVIFWPRLPDSATSTQRQVAQAKAIRTALDWADRTEGWCILVDELMWVSRNLRLEREIESVYFQGRTQGISMIGCAQRPSHVPLLAFSQATYLFLWQSSDGRDLERLREISAGFPKGMIDESVRQLNWDEHEALFVNTKTKELARVVAPARI